MIFGRTDLRIGVSGAKFDAESDFEIRLAVAPQKPNQNGENLIIQSKNKLIVLSASKNEMSGIVWNAFWPKDFVRIRKFQG